MKRIRNVLATALTLTLAGVAPAFDIITCDSSLPIEQSAANRGWAEPTAASIGSILVDTRGAPSSGIPTATVLQSWQDALDIWAGISNSQLTFQAVTQTSVTTQQVVDALDFTRPPDNERIFLVVEGDTQFVVPGLGTFTGWEGLFGIFIPVSTTLGVAFPAIEVASLNIVDGSVFINNDQVDDGLGVAPSIFQGTPVTGAVSIDDIMQHEVGHFIGAAHSIDTAALMFPSASAGAVKGMQEDDFNVARFLYTAPGHSPLPPDRNNLLFIACQTLGNVVATGESLVTLQDSGCMLGGGGLTPPGSVPAGFGILACAWLGLVRRRLRREPIRS